MPSISLLKQQSRKHPLDDRFLREESFVDVIAIYLFIKFNHQEVELTRLY